MGPIRVKSASNQLSNDRGWQRPTPADADGRLTAAQDWPPLFVIDEAVVVPRPCQNVGDLVIPSYEGLTITDFVSDHI